MLRRLFFGAQVEAPWPQEFPPGRLIPENTRHMTLAFLGNQDLSKLQPLLAGAPRPSFQIGPVGIAKELVFLPVEHSRVVALDAQWLEEPAWLSVYQKELMGWLKQHQYPVDERPFFPHITLARAPFDKEAWEQAISPLPFFVKGIHLYESLGNLEYRSLWEMALIPPFEEIAHTADIAFDVKGLTPQQIHLHAELALSFHFPQLIPFFDPYLKDTVEEIIISLNNSVAKADQEWGCPFKAVSFHGAITSDQQQILHWEMIVDV